MKKFFKLLIAILFVPLNFILVVPIYFAMVIMISYESIVYGVSPLEIYKSILVGEIDV